MPYSETPYYKETTVLEHLATYALAYVLLLAFISIAYSWFDSHRNNELWYQSDK